MIVCRPSTARRLYGPSVYAWSARQESAAVIACGALQYGPIQILVDNRPTSDLHPGLASMVGIHLGFNPEVRARSELRNRNASSIVPLLPGTKSLSKDVRVSAARSGRRVEMPSPIVAIRATMWAIPEVVWHISRVIAIPYTMRIIQFVLTDGIHQPSMAGRLLDQQRGEQGLQHL